MSTRLRHITVDLTPLQPGGENGGAKPVALSLMRQFQVLAPETHFTLLTSVVSHEELAELDAPNMQRQCVDPDLTPITLERGKLGTARTAARVLVNTLVPPDARTRVKDGVWTVVKRHRRAEVARALLADLHFSPLTAPFFADPRVPQVSLVHDLQFLAYPQFFNDEIRAGRQRHFEDACRRSDRLVCVSDFVRETVLDNSALSPSAVQTIHSTVLHAGAPVAGAAEVTHAVLARIGFTRSRFLLYPANAWPHKNHRGLLSAFAAYEGQKSGSDLGLVFTGAPGSAFDELMLEARRTLPAGAAAFAGHLGDIEFRALLQSCRALIFPSLYEGFGLPVLEAMACGRPVLCSNVASLPEIAGDAALCFEPRAPESIAAAIHRLESEPDLEPTLIARGRVRLAKFGTPSDWAARYLSAFEEVVTAREWSQRR